LDPIESNDHHCHVELFSIFYRYKKLAPCTGVYSSNERSGIKTVVIDTETDTVNSSLQTRDEFQPSSDRFSSQRRMKRDQPSNQSGRVDGTTKEKKWTTTTQVRLLLLRKRQNEPPNRHSRTHTATFLIFTVFCPCLVGF